MINLIITLKYNAVYYDKVDESLILKQVIKKAQEVIAKENLEGEFVIYKVGQVKSIINNQSFTYYYNLCQKIDV